MPCQLHAFNFFQIKREQTLNFSWIKPVSDPISMWTECQRIECHALNLFQYLFNVLFLILNQVFWLLFHIEWPLDYSILFHLILNHFIQPETVSVSRVTICYGQTAPGVSRRGSGWAMAGSYGYTDPWNLKFSNYSYIYKLQNIHRQRHMYM